MAGITQREIARLAGTSQATVSLVLNDAATGRLAPETVTRVREVIRETGYVANPAARQLVRGSNQIVGIFTYEAVFPSATANFYHAFLIGLERAAERLGWDLLMLTSAPVIDGRRRLFHENSRLQLADACVLIGREVLSEDLARLNASGYPYVSVGRRDDAGGPVPYVGAGYAPATKELTKQAIDLGHRHLMYLADGSRAEALRDRYKGFRSAVGRSREVRAERFELTKGSHAEAVERCRSDGISCVLIEEGPDGEQFLRECRRRKIKIPEDLSVILLNEPVNPTVGRRQLTHLAIPREDMGEQALDVLVDLIKPGKERIGPQHQRMLPVTPVSGATVVPCRRGAL